MGKSKFVLVALTTGSLLAACSSSKVATKATSTTVSSGTAVTTTVAGGATTVASTTQPLTVPVTTTPTAPTTTVSTGGNNWEVVAGIFTTSAKAQAQITKLTAGKFPGFSIKQVSGQFAVVLPGLSNADATAMSTKVTNSGIATSHVFQVTDAGSTTTAAKGTTTTTTAKTTTTVSATATNFEVVGGIYQTQALAQAQIDKLTKGGFTGFTIKKLTTTVAAVKVGLTKADADALVKKITAAGLGSPYTKQV